MTDIKIFESEYRFCTILWENEPINSTALVALCKEQLGWSKATTYTVIRRLAERGIVQSENATVTALISKEDAQAAQIDELMSSRFDDSLPAFLAAFSKRQNLSQAQVAEILRIIEE
ncbi:MAG: BlaI/MecI/CopY family transcriptional regulator [Clostridia bacterium]|nr:BlaI/MecI/CopY family transcriptional regulator [Clostridia bacterium]